MLAVSGMKPAETNEVTGMVTVLPFQLGITKDAVTPHAGLALFGEFVDALILPALLNKALPMPSSGAGRIWYAFFFPLAWEGTGASSVLFKERCTAMIEVDPLQYLGENYLVRWQCPMCEGRSFIRLGDIDKAHCPQCGQMLAPEERTVLDQFRRYIA
jgi:hypothetical protein